MEKIRRNQLSTECRKQPPGQSFSSISFLVAFREFEMLESTPYRKVKQVFGGEIGWRQTLQCPLDFGDFKKFKSIKNC